MGDIYTEALNGSLTADTLQAYLRNNPSIIDRPGGSKNLTPLAAACSGGHLKVVNLLLKEGQANPNTVSSHQRTPLFYATSWSPDRDRAAIVRALLSAGAKVDVSFPEDGNNTPLMQAIQASDQDAVHELVDHGASVTTKNDDGETAQMLAANTRMDLRNRKDRSLSYGDMFDTIVAVVLQIIWLANKLFIDTVNKVFKFAGSRNDNPANATNTLDPVTVADYEASIKQYVAKDTNLEDFFGSDDPFFTRLATRAAALRSDPEITPDIVQRLTIAALYQPVIYGDDSGSMNGPDGGSWNKQRELIVRIARIATMIIPEELAVELRFINSPLSLKLSAEKVRDAIDTVKPSGITEIGTHLRGKILEPLVYQVLRANRRLERPLLVCIITDGCPNEEATDTLRREIADCKRFLQDHKYRPTAVMYSISQIGDDEDAKAFLADLRNNKDIQDVLYCTTDRLDDQFKDLRGNEKDLEKWLLKLLTAPIMREKN